MNKHEKVSWYNKRDPFHKWVVGQDVYCLHCDAVFKAEDIGQDSSNLPECPLCGATPLDLHPIPWWRDDLVEQSVVREQLVNKWKVEPVLATAGQPKRLPD